MSLKPRLTLFVILMAGASFAGATTAFVNVNLLPMSTDGIIAGQTVIVDDGMIMLVGDVESIPVPEGALVVDGTDRYLMPGLVEMHAHVPAVGGEELDRVLTLFVANGVTTMRGMLGHPSHLVLRQELIDGRFGPRLITAAPSLNGETVSTPEQGRRLVSAYHEAGYDFLKIHPGLSPAEFAAIANASKAVGMSFSGHVTESVGLEGVLAAGMTTIDHLDGYLESLMPHDADPSGGYGGFFGVLLADQVDDARIPEIVQATVAAGTWNVPTESLFEQLVSPAPVDSLVNRPEMRFVTRETLEQWVQARQQLQGERGFSPELALRAIAIRRELIRSLYEAGAGLLLGSDAPQIFNVPGFSLHDELKLLVTSGLPPIAALQTGTMTAAGFLGTNTGIIEVGRDADLVLLDASPLDDISNSRRIHGVMVRGTWFSSAELEDRLSRFDPNRE